MIKSTDLQQRLMGLLGPTAVITEGSDLEPYAVDWRKLFPGRPACVVRPSSTEQVAQIVRICREAGAAIVPQGGNTGLAGGAVGGARGRMHPARRLSCLSTGWLPSAMSIRSA
jgi:FAD/FMN-containing dehydrogenase